LDGLQPAQLRVQGATGTAGTAADYAHVEALTYDGSQSLVTTFHAALFSGEFSILSG
jgi:hypothetical protein